MSAGTKWAFLAVSVKVWNGGRSGLAQKIANETVFFRRSAVALWLMMATGAMALAVQVPLGVAPDAVADGVPEVSAPLSQSKPANEAAPQTPVWVSFGEPTQQGVPGVTEADAPALFYLTDNSDRAGDIPKPQDRQEVLPSPRPRAPEIAEADAEARVASQPPSPISETQAEPPQTAQDILSTLSEAPAAAPDVADEPNSDPPAEASARLQAFGTEVPATEAPKLGILLIDEGVMGDAPALVAALELPVSVAVRAEFEGVDQRIAAFREAGVEVAAILPAGMGLGEAAEQAPMVFGVLVDGSWASAQAQHLPALKEEGWGVVLSAASPAAQQAFSGAGVPHLVAALSFDDGEETGAVMRRFLDQAAFQARQTPESFTIGTLRPETIDVLSEWKRSDRAGQVQILPVSQLLRTVAAEER